MGARIHWICRNRRPLSPYVALSWYPPSEAPLLDRDLASWGLALYPLAPHVSLVEPVRLIVGRLRPRRRTIGRTIRTLAVDFIALML